VSQHGANTAAGAVQLPRSPFFYPLRHNAAKSQCGSRIMSVMAKTDHNQEAVGASRCAKAYDGQGSSAVSL